MFVLHKRSIASLFHTNPSMFDAFGDGSRYVAFNRSIDPYLSRPHSDWDLTDHASIAYTLPPNTVLVTQGQRVDVWPSFPLDPNTCPIRLRVYAKRDLAAAKSPEQWDFKAQFVSDVVWNEDFALAEGIQAALTANALSELVFGANEPAVIHYHRSLQRMLAAISAVDP